MKKHLLAIFALLLSAVSASAFVFDGIDFNENASVISRKISEKGYIYDVEANALKGICQGTPILLSLNLDDVNTKGKVGQLIINIPSSGFSSDKQAALKDVTTILNIIYHQTAQIGWSYVYEVDKDGTTLTVSSTADGIKLVYNTPYYKKAN